MKKRTIWMICFLFVIPLGGLLGVMCSRRYDGKTPMLAARDSGANQVQPADHAPDDGSQKVDGSATVWFNAAIGGHTSEVQAMITAGVDVNQRDQDGRSALWLSAVNGQQDAEVAKLLLQAGADVNAKDNDGIAPLAAAMDPHGTPAIIDALLDGGADVNTLDLYGQTPLSRAASSGDTGLIVQEFLKRGANPNSKQYDGKTPLMKAAEFCHSEAVEALIRAGADPTAEDNEGKTALMLAQRFKEKFPTGMNAFVKESIHKTIELLKSAEASQRK